MLRRKLLILAAATPFTQVAFAAQPGIFTGLVQGVAVGGYDAVSYFYGDPMPGKADYTVQWHGASWQFASADNAKMFTSAPEKYAPQYGGYCAYAVAQGATAKGDPLAWTVVNMKLYLNYSPSISEKWRKDIPGYITAANANWPKVLE